MGSQALRVSPQQSDHLGLSRLHCPLALGLRDTPKRPEDLLRRQGFDPAEGPLPVATQPLCRVTEVTSASAESRYRIIVFL